MSGSSGILSNLIVNLVANIEGFQAGMNSAADSLQKAGQKMANLGAAWTQNVTAPIIAGAAVIFKVANDFQDKLGEMAAATGITEDAANALGQSLLKLAPEVGKGPTELIGPLGQIVTAGYEGAEAIEILRAAGKAAAAGIGDLETNTAALVTTLKSQEKGTVSTAEAMDTLVAAQAAGRTSIDELGTQLGKLGPAMREAGVGAKDTASAIALITLKTGDTAIAGKQLKAFFEEINNPSKTMTKALAAAGTSADQLKAAIAKDGLAKAMGTLGYQLSIAGVEMNSVFKSTSALDAAMQLTDHSTSALGDTFDSVHGSVGRLDRAFATAGGPDLLERTMALVQVALVKLGTVVVPLINKALEALNEKLEQGIKWWDSLSDETKQNLVYFAGLLAAVGPLLVVFGSLVTFAGWLVGAFATLFGWVAAGITALQSLGGLFVALRVALAALAGPVGIVLGLLSTLIYYFWDDLPGAVKTAGKAISEGLSGAWKSIQKFATGLIKDFPGSFEKAAKGAIKAVKWLWDQIGKISVPDLAKGLFDGLGAVVKGLAGLISDGVVAAVGALEEIFAGVVTSIKDLFVGFFDWTTGTIGDLWNKLKSWFTGEASPDSGGSGSVTADMTPVVGLLEQILAAIQNLRIVIDDGGGAGGGSGDGSGGGGGERYGTVGFVASTDAEAYGLMQSLMDRMIAEDERVGQSWVYAIEEMAEALHLVRYSPDATDDEPDVDCPCAPWLQQIIDRLGVMTSSLSGILMASIEMKPAVVAAAAEITQHTGILGAIRTSLQDGAPSDLSALFDMLRTDLVAAITDVGTKIGETTAAIQAMAADITAINDHFTGTTQTVIPVDGGGLTSQITQTITFNLDSRVIAEATVQHFPDVLTLNGA